MTTGRIWNGGEVPVIGDPMYMSIVDELRQPTGKPQGKESLQFNHSAGRICRFKSRSGPAITDFP